MKRYLEMTLAFMGTTACLPPQQQPQQFSLVLGKQPTPDHLKVNNKVGTVTDTHNKEIVLRGVQVPLGYRTTQDSAMKPEVLEKIADYGFNFVRVTWSTINDYEYNNDLKVLTQFIDKAINEQLLVMLEAHNLTGLNTNLDQAAKYWASLFPNLKDYQDHLMINIANEWGNHELPMETYISNYQEAIRIIRDAGYKLPLVIDAGGWGQNITYLTKDDQWKKLSETDQQKMGQPNLMYSVHMYGNWAIDSGGLYSVKKDFLDFKKKAPVLIGEFGWNKPGNPDNSKLDLNDFLNIVKEHQINVCVYSWSGNNPSYHNDKTKQTLNYSYLDVVPANYQRDPQQGKVIRYDFQNHLLTDFGKQLIKNDRLVIAQP